MEDNASIMLPGSCRVWRYKDNDTVSQHHIHIFSTLMKVQVVSFLCLYTSYYQVIGV